MNSSEKYHDKLYSSIGEVASMLNINSSVIRFWEKDLGDLHSKKNRKGERLFTPADVEKLKYIHHLLKEKGFTIEGAKNVLKHQNQKLLPNFEAVKTLQQVKEFLIQIKEELEKNE